MVTLVYYSVSETAAILSEYLTYSVTVAFEYNTNESFELPDLTVCNVNPLRRSALCALDPTERAMDPELEERLCGKEQTFREVGLVMTLNMELDEYLPTSYQAGFIVMIHAHGTR
ncbi:hypothetical protein V5799_014706, partial [Amblyomma americanum]